MLLGSRSSAAPIPVKNTFVDLPSVLTPTTVTGHMRQPLLTAPAGLHKSIFLSPDCSIFPAFVPLDSPAYAAEGCMPPSSGVPFADCDGPPGLEHPASTRSSRIHTMESAEPKKKELIASQVHDIPLVDDEEEDGEETEQPTSAGDIPAPPPGALHPSIGSEGHASGECKRCCFFPRGRCANGYLCTFCHYEHERRKRKSKRNTNKEGKVASALQQGTAPVLPAPQIMQLGHVALQAQCLSLPAHAQVVQPCPVAYHIAAGRPTLLPLHPAGGSMMYNAAPACYPFPQQYYVGHSVHMVPTTTGFMPTVASAAQCHSDQVVRLAPAQSGMA